MSFKYTFLIIGIWFQALNASTNRQKLKDTYYLFQEVHWNYLGVSENPTTSADFV